MDGMMDVVVERPITMNDDEAGGASDSGSTVVNSDTNNDNNDGSNTSHNNEEGEKHASDDKKESTGERKSRKKKERRKKEKKDRAEKEKTEKKPKGETQQQLLEENAQLKNDLNDLQLRLVYLEARDHNKELKLIHLQKELEETRSILIEKEGDCVEWEQIDREKDKTVISLNQTIAILQRDLTVLLEEKEGSHTPKKQIKKTNRLVFSPKPEEVFEYPREEDYDSDEDLTSDYEDEEEDGSPEERKDGEEGEDSEEYNEVIEKEIDEEQPNPVFFPFPSLSNLAPVEAPAPSQPQAAIVENPLVKIFSPTLPPSQPDFGFDSPSLSHHSSTSSSPIPSPEVKHSHPHPPSNPPPSHKANGTPPPSHPNGASPRRSPSVSPSNSSSNLSIKTESSSSLPPLPSPPPSLSPTHTHFPASPRETEIPTTVSVRELRSMWEQPKSAANTSTARITK